MPDDTLLDDFILSMRIAMQGYRIAYCKNAYALEEASADMTEEGKRKSAYRGRRAQSIGRLAPLLNPIALRHTLVAIPLAPRTRWSVTPILLFALVPLNIALVAGGPHRILYGTILLLQAVFYGCALQGYRLSQRKIKNKLLFVPYYFLFMNLNVLRGIAYLRRRRGQQTGVWEKAKRAA